MDISALGSSGANVQKMTGYKPVIPVSQAAAIQQPVSTPTATGAVQKVDPAPSLDQVKKAVEDINKSLQSLSQGLEFSIDTDTKQTVVKVIDHQTKEVIRQMPSVEALQIAKSLDQVLGKLLSEKA